MINKGNNDAGWPRGLTEEEQKDYSNTVANEIVGWTCEVRHTRDEDEIISKAIEIIRSYGTTI